MIRKMGADTSWHSSLVQGMAFRLKSVRSGIRRGDKQISDVSCVSGAQKVKGVGDMHWGERVGLGHSTLWTSLQGDMEL